MRPLVVHCRLGRGVLLRRTEQTDRAREELSTAIELYQAMDMTFWLARAPVGLDLARASV